MRRNRFPLDDDRIHSRAEQTLAYTHMHSDKAVAALERFDAMLGQFDGAKWPVN
jgi:hypothetical protein